METVTLTIESLSITTQKAAKFPLGNKKPDLETFVARNEVSYEHISPSGFIVLCQPSVVWV